MRKPVHRFPTRPNTNQAVRSQKMARAQNTPHRTHLPLQPHMVMDPPWAEGPGLYAVTMGTSGTSYTPRKLCLLEGILFSRCPNERMNDRTNASVSVTFCFLDILKSLLWNFFKLCKNIHMYKANTTYKKLRARGRYYRSYFPL